MSRRAIAVPALALSFSLLASGVAQASHPVVLPPPPDRAGASAASEQGDPDAAPGGAQAYAASVLRVGMRGGYVVRLQRRLNIKADGQFGPKTERAVKAFQRRRGLVADGVVGPLTARALGLPLPRVKRVGGSRQGNIPAVLEKIAQCESGGNPRAVSPSGQYRGKYQFDRPTWRSMGGKGDPAKASEAEQDRRALALYRQRGSAPWPSCG